MNNSEIKPKLEKLKSSFGLKTNLILLIVLVIATVSSIVWTILAHQAGQMNGTTAQLIIAGFGALSSTLLAVATVISVLMNSRMIEEKKLDREKPLIKDELSKVIQPAIHDVKANESMYEEDTINWLYLDPDDPFNQMSVLNGGANFLLSSIRDKEPDQTILRRVKYEYELVYEDMEKHDRLLEKGSEKAKELFNSFENDLEKFIRENNLQRPLSEDLVETKTIAAQLLEPGRGMGDKFREIVWDPYVEDFARIFEENTDKENVQELAEIKKQYRRQLYDTKHVLINTQSDLLEKFGLSAEQIETNTLAEDENL